MSKYKKLFGFVFAISICLSSLTACGATSEQESAENETSIEAGSDDAVPENTEDESGLDDQDDSDMQMAGELKEGDAAPDFTATLVDGSEFKMSDHKDDVVILNFFASWCGPCMREMPAFDMLKKDEYSNLSILCVNCEEDKTTVDALVENHGFTFPIAYDEDGTIGAKYPSEGIPYTLIIKNGVIEKIFLGAQDADTQYKEYKGAIDACMN